MAEDYTKSENRHHFTCQNYSKGETAMNATSQSYSKEKRAINTLSQNYSKREIVALINWKAETDLCGRIGDV